MTEKLCRSMTDWLVSREAIEESSRAIYEYGLYLFILTMLNVTTALTLGALLQVFWPTCLFLLFFMPLRQYAGGYHAKTSLRCYFLSTGAMLASQLMFRFWLPEKEISVALFLGASVLVWLLAPVPALTKPLSSPEYRAYRKRARLVLAVQLLLMVVFLLLQAEEILFYLALAVTMASILVVAGRIQNWKNPAKA